MEKGEDTMSIGMNCYILHIDYKGERQNLNAIANKNLIMILKEMADYYNKPTEHDKKISYFKHYQCKSYSIEDKMYYDSFFATFSSGEYGQETDIVEKSTMERTHTKKETEAEIKPFGIFVAIPQIQCFETVIILQTCGRSGVKTIFAQLLQKYLQTIDEDYVLGIGPLYPRKFLSIFLSSWQVKKMKIYRYGIADAEAAAYGVNDKPEDVRTVTEIKSQSGFNDEVKNNIQSVLRGQKLYSSLVEIDEESVTDIKYEFSKGSVKRTVSMKNIDSAIISEDITDRVVLDKGNPTKDSLEIVFNETWREYMAELNAAFIIHDNFEEEIWNEGNGEELVNME